MHPVQGEQPVRVTCTQEVKASAIAFVSSALASAKLIAVVNSVMNSMAKQPMLRPVAGAVGALARCVGPIAAGVIGFKLAQKLIPMPEEKARSVVMTAVMGTVIGLIAQDAGIL